MNLKHLFTRKIYVITDPNANYISGPHKRKKQVNQELVNLPDDNHIFKIWPENFEKFKNGEGKKFIKVS